MTVWQEYGVKLDGGQVAAAASEQIARDYCHGWPVARDVRVTAIPNCGQAVVDTGEWKTLRRRRREPS